jgi:hypothetical protein
MSRGSATGYAATSGSWAPVFTAASDGPCDGFIVQNFAGAAANLVFRVTGLDGYATTGAVEPGSLVVIRPGSAGVSTVEFKSSGADITGFGFPATWVNP